MKASKWVDQFLGKGSKSFTQDEIKKSKFGEYFEHLQQNLDGLAEDNTLLRTANKILSLDIDSNDLKLLIDQLLHIIPGFGFEFRRLILIPEEDLKEGSLGIDNSSKDLSYLDSQIIELLEKNERIFIHDTSKIRTIKFQPDKAIPKSILGLSIKAIIGWRCYLWYANSYEVNLDKDQVDGLELIKTAVAKSISGILQSVSLGKESQLWKSAFDQMPHPSFLFRGNEIVARNLEAEKILPLSKQQENDAAKEKILSAIKQEKSLVEINDRSFRINYFIPHGSEDSDALFVFLVNENEITIQRNYLSHVMQGVSLNIKTPLHNILGFSGMIPLLADVDRSQQDYLDRIGKEARNCLTYTEDLLEVSRFSGEEPLINREVSIGDLTTNFIEVSHHLLRQKRISIANKIEDPDQIVKVDIPLFGQAFYLVLEYILDQLDSGKTISVLSGSDEEEFWYQLSDNGKGISDIDVALLNQQESDSNIDSRIRVAGNIIKLNGGRLTIRSELGKGSEYTFFWRKI